MNTSMAGKQAVAEENVKMSVKRGETAWRRKDAQSRGFQKGMHEIDSDDV